jgi:hypothetical protein
VGLCVGYRSRRHFEVSTVVIIDHVCALPKRRPPESIARKKKNSGKKFLSLKSRSSSVPVKVSAFLQSMPIRTENGGRGSSHKCWEVFLLSVFPFRTSCMPPCMLRPKTASSASLSVVVRILVSSFQGRDAQIL